MLCNRNMLCVMNMGKLRAVWSLLEMTLRNNIGGELDSITTTGHPKVACWL